jgi:hypothetical protein
MSTHESTETQIWGIGWYPAPSGTVAYAPTAAIIDRDIVIAGERLDALGIGFDDMIVLASRTSEATQFAPFEAAANARGAAYSCLDGNRADGQRLGALIQLLKPKALLGIGESLILGVADTGADIATLLASVPVVAARPRAQAALADLGIPSMLWLHAGPAVAVGCGRADGAHIADAWRPHVVDGRLHVTLATGDQLDTGIEATLTTVGCACGSSAPTVQLTAVPDFAG